MGLRQLPNNLTLEELLNTIEKSEDKNVVGVSDDVFSFISHFNVLPGNNKVLISTLYKLYKNWSSEPITKHTFVYRMSRHFITQRYSNKHYYLLNLDSLKVEYKILELLTNKKINKKNSPVVRKHFEEYLTFYNITKGNKWIEGYILAHLYDKWCYNKNIKRKLTDINFINFCKLYFEHKKNGDNKMIWFGVNKEFVSNHLPSNTLINLQQARKRKHGKKQKRKSKVPSTTT